MSSVKKQREMWGELCSRRKPSVSAPEAKERSQSRYKHHTDTNILQPNKLIKQLRLASSKNTIFTILLKGGSTGMMALLLFVFFSAGFEFWDKGKLKPLTAALVKI